MQDHPSVILQLNEDIAQLGPGKYHHGQVTSCARQGAGDLSGSKAVGRGGTALAPEGSAPQKNDPVYQGQCSQHDHNDLQGADLLLSHRLPGEHLIAYLQVHRQGLLGFQILDDLAGDGITGHGKFHRGLDALLMVAAFKHRLEIFR